MVLTGDRVDPVALRESIRASVEGDRVTVAFPDGEELEVALGTQPAYARYPSDSSEVVRWPAALVQA